MCSSDWIALNAVNRSGECGLDWLSAFGVGHCRGAPPSETPFCVLTQSQWAFHCLVERPGSPVVSCIHKNLIPAKAIGLQLILQCDGSTARVRRHVCGCS
jgi:hypothetical protein